MLTDWSPLHVAAHICYFRSESNIVLPCMKHILCGFNFAWTDRLHFIKYMSGYKYLYHVTTKLTYFLSNKRCCTSETRNLLVEKWRILICFIQFHETYNGHFKYAYIIQSVYLSVCVYAQDKTFFLESTEVRIFECWYSKQQCELSYPMARVPLCQIWACDMP
jgi:hypothetical protein